MKQFKFSTEIDFIGVPIKLTYEATERSKADKKWLRGKMSDDQQITLPRLISRILAAFGLNGIDFGFDGLGVRNIEINFDLDNELVDFKSKMDANELWLKFSFNFREIKVGNKKGFVFEFIPDDSKSNGDQNNRLAFPGGLPLIKDELKNNLYIEFSKVVVATISDPANKEIKEGLQILGKYKIFGSEQDIDIYLFGPDPSAPTARSLSMQSRSANGVMANKLTKWFDVDKSLGPFTLRKIGFQYDELVWAMVSSDFKMGPLIFSMEGLKVGFPLKAPPPIDQIEFGLNGIGVSVADGPIQITGSFLKSSDPKFENYYSGMALISLSEFTVEAFGGYGELPNKDKAFFIFTSVNAPHWRTAFFLCKGIFFGFWL